MNEVIHTQDTFINITQHLLDNVLAIGLLHCNLIKYNFMIFTNIVNDNDEVMGFIAEFFNGKKYIYLKDSAIVNYLSLKIFKDK